MWNMKRLFRNGHWQEGLMPESGLSPSERSQARRHAASCASTSAGDEPRRRMMAGAESIRDVIAFPKTQRAQCLLTDAPSDVDEKQLRELHIRLRQKVETQVEVGKG